MPSLLLTCWGFVASTVSAFAFSFQTTCDAFGLPLGWGGLAFALPLALGIALACMKTTCWVFGTFAFALWLVLLLWALGSQLTIALPFAFAGLALFFDLLFT